MRKFHLLRKKVDQNESWVLLFRFVCDPVRAVAELSDARNAAHSGWQTQSLCARAADGGRKAGPQRGMEQVFELSRQHYQGPRSCGYSAVGENLGPAAHRRPLERPHECAMFAARPWLYHRR